MFSDLQKYQSTLLSKILSSFVAITFLLTMILPPGYAQTILGLPEPGTRVALSAEHAPCLLKGVTVRYDNPFRFDFIMDTGSGPAASREELQAESRRLIKYFMASLTIPADDLWVNLSPYEKDRIITDSFGWTEMGRDMLAQDYLLKQLSSSLIYPEEELGQKFWDRAYAKAHEQYGTTEIPLNTFNKVWIIPETAVVYERAVEPTKENPSAGRTAFVVESRLKVMLEEDYLALKSNLGNAGLGTDRMESAGIEEVSALTSDIYRDVVLPEIEREVNEGRTFANLRQIFNSMILAVWYKRNLRETIFGQVYADKNKISGVDVEDKSVKQKIYDQYLAALKKGVFNYIKEDYDQYAQEPVPRKYFSGGTDLARWLKDNLKEVKDLQDLSAEGERRLLPVGEALLVTAEMAGREPVGKNSVKELLENKGYDDANAVQDWWDEILDVAHSKEVKWIKAYKIRVGDPDDYESIKKDLATGIGDDVPGAERLRAELFRNIVNTRERLIRMHRAGLDGAQTLLEDFKRQLRGETVSGVKREVSYIHISDEQALREALQQALASIGIYKHLNDIVIPRGHASDTHGINLLDPEALFHEVLAGAGLTDGEADKVEEGRISADQWQPIGRKIAGNFPNGVRQADLLRSERMRFSRDIAKAHPENPMSLEIVRSILRRQDSAGEVTDEQFQRAYQQLNGRYPGGVTKAVYDALYKETNLDVFVGGDIRISAEEMARAMILYYQEVVQTPEFLENPNKKVKQVFSTGDTPWKAYRIYADIIHSWDTDETQALLEEWGLDRAIRPDPRRILAFPLDAVFPQLPADYHSFYNILNNMFERIGIPEENRRLFEGNLIYNPQKDSLRSMSPAEYAELLKDIDEHDINFEEYGNKNLEGRFQQGQLDRGGRLQYLFLKAMDQQAKDMAQELVRDGGPHIFIWGIGPGYKGEGHVGFMEGGVTLQKEAFIGKAGHFIAAGHAKEHGGYAKTSRGHGFVTFGFKELLHRQGENPVKVIGIATGNNKSRSVLKHAEGVFRFNENTKLEFPVQGMRNQQGILITDRSSAGDLRVEQHPWDFRLFKESDWTDGMIKALFVRVALEAGQPLEKLEPEDFLNGPGKEHVFINKIRQRNLRTLQAKKAWRDIQKDLLKEFSPVDTNGKGSLVLPGEIHRKLGWHKGDTKEIVKINPHLDDDYLAELEMARQFIKGGHHVSFFYTAKGSTAVDENYVKNILAHIAQWDQKRINEILKRNPEDIAKALVKILEKKGKPQDLVDYDIWKRMGKGKDEGGDLRAQALLWDISNKLTGGRLKTKEQIERFVGLCRYSIDHHVGWGHRDITLVAEIKTFLRVTEGRTAIMSLGGEFKDIHEPWDTSWYTQEGRGGTAGESDVEIIKSEIRDMEIKPDLIVTNGEGFPDYGAHSTTETSVIRAVKDLLEEGILDENTKIITYEGVWARKDAARAKMSLVLTPEQVENLEIKAPNHYPSQFPPPIPDSGFDTLKLFSEAVTANAMASKDEYLKLIPLPQQSADYSPAQEILAREGSGILNYDILDLSDESVLKKMEAKADELERVRGTVERASNQELNGYAPMPDLFQSEGYTVRGLFDILSLMECSWPVITAFLKDYVNEEDPLRIMDTLAGIAEEDTTGKAHQVYTALKAELGKTAYMNEKQAHDWQEHRDDVLLENAFDPKVRFIQAETMSLKRVEENAEAKRNYEDVMAFFMQLQKQRRLDRKFADKERRTREVGVSRLVRALVTGALPWNPEVRARPRLNFVRINDPVRLRWYWKEKRPPRSHASDRGVYLYSWEDFMYAVAAFFGLNHYEATALEIVQKQWLASKGDIISVVQDPGLDNRFRQLIKIDDYAKRWPGSLQDAFFSGLEKLTKNLMTKDGRLQRPPGLLTSISSEQERANERAYGKDDMPESVKKVFEVMSDKDKDVLSIGMSTGGETEMLFARLNPDRHVVATTIDSKGLELTREKIQRAGLSDRVKAIRQNVRNKMRYADNSFDFVYARLVLHYLDREGLKKALEEIRRVLKPGGKVYIVAKTGVDDEELLWASQHPDFGENPERRPQYNPVTGMTRYGTPREFYPHDFVEPEGSRIPEDDEWLYAYRQFLPPDILTGYLKDADFEVYSPPFTFKEQVGVDYARSALVPAKSALVSMTAVKSKSPGGIDLNPALFSMEVRRDDKGVPLPLPQQPVYNMEFEGFMPVIINITPLTDLNLLLGLDIEKDNSVGKLSRIESLKSNI